MLVSIHILCFHNILLQHRRKSMGKMFYQRVSFGTMVKAECIDWVQVDGFRVWWQLRCKIYIRGEAAPTSLKAGMRGQGLVTCDQGLVARDQVCGTRKTLISNLCGASDFYAPHHHFTFLISHSRETFKRNQRAAQPTGEPRTLHHFIIYTQKNAKETIECIFF